MKYKSDVTTISLFRCHKSLPKQYNMKYKGDEVRFAEETRGNKLRPVSVQKTVEGKVSLRVISISYSGRMEEPTNNGVNT